MAGTGNTSIRSYNFFSSGAIVGAASTGTFAENQHDFIDVDDGTLFLSKSLIISNDGSVDIQFRFSADPGTAAAHGVVKSTETLQLDFKRSRRVFLSGVKTGSAFRLWAW